MLKRTYDKTAYIYILPAFVLMLIFMLYPIVNTIVTSFKADYSLLTGEFTRYGVKHYIETITDPVFGRAFVNTMFLAFVCVPASMLTALVTALLLNSVKRFQSFFTTLFYLPQVTNVIAAGMVFALLFNNNFGLVNVALGWFGIKPVEWISGVGIAGSKELYNISYARCLFVLFVYSTWQGLSLKVILFLSGLQNINKQYYDAAKIDDISGWKIFSKITFPLLSPTTVYVFITSSITAFKSYAAVVALFGERYGPAGDNSKMLITIVGYIIDCMGDYMSAGAISAASTAALILMIIVMLFTAVQLGLSKKWVHYK